MTALDTNVPTRVLAIQAELQTSNSCDEHPVATVVQRSEQPADAAGCRNRQDTHSSDQHPADAAGSSGDRRKKRAADMMQLLSELSTEDDMEVYNLLLYPVLRKKQTRADGVALAGPVDMTATVKLLETAIDFTTRARAEVDVHEDGVELTDAQFGIAHNWLKLKFSKMNT